VRELTNIKTSFRIKESYRPKNRPNITLESNSRPATINTIPRALIVTTTIVSTLVLSILTGTYAGLIDVSSV